jgi:signal transduction histidine kinase
MKWDRSIFAIKDVIVAALDGLLPVFGEKKILVVQELDCEDVQVNADRDRIQQVITNLLENAVKFSRKGGRIWMGCRSAAEDSNGRPTLLVTVRDEGHGIPEDHLERIFERFSQADHTDTRGTGGSGLGLAISKEIVEYHGGRIWAESVHGEGATFLFTMPSVVRSGASGGGGGGRPEKEEQGESNGKTKRPSAVTKENGHA